MYKYAVNNAIRSTWNLYSKVKLQGYYPQFKLLIIQLKEALLREFEKTLKLSIFLLPNSLRSSTIFRMVYYQKTTLKLDGQFVYLNQTDIIGDAFKDQERLVVYYPMTKFVGISCSRTEQSLLSCVCIEVVRTDHQLQYCVEQLMLKI